MEYARRKTFLGLTVTFATHHITFMVKIHLALLKREYYILIMTTIDVDDANEDDDISG